MRWTWLNWPAPARRIVAGAFIVFVNWLLLAPSTTFRDVHVFLAHQDKLAHLGIFGILAGLVRWSIPALWGKGWKRFALVMALLAYGVSSECAQLLLPSLGRSFEWADLLCDSIGIALGLWLCERLTAYSLAIPPSDA